MICFPFQLWSNYSKETKWKIDDKTLQLEIFSYYTLVEVKSKTISNIGKEEWCLRAFIV